MPVIPEGYEHEFVVTMFEAVDQQTGKGIGLWAAHLVRAFENKVKIDLPGGGYEWKPLPRRWRVFSRLSDLTPQGEAEANARKLAEQHVVPFRMGIVPGDLAMMEDVPKRRRKRRSDAGVPRNGGTDRGATEEDVILRLLSDPAKRAALKALLQDDPPAPPAAPAAPEEHDPPSPSPDETTVPEA